MDMDQYLGEGTTIAQNWQYHECIKNQDEEIVIFLIFYYIYQHINERGLHCIQSEHPEQCNLCPKT